VVLFRFFLWLCPANRVPTFVCVPLCSCRTLVQINYGTFYRSSFFTPLTSVSRLKCLCCPHVAQPRENYFQLQEKIPGVALVCSLCICVGSVHVWNVSSAQTRSLPFVSSWKADTSEANGNVLRFLRQVRLWILVCLFVVVFVFYVERLSDVANLEWCSWETIAKSIHYCTYFAQENFWNPASFILVIIFDFQLLFVAMHVYVTRGVTWQHLKVLL